MRNIDYRRTLKLVGILISVVSISLTLMAPTPPPTAQSQCEGLGIGGVWAGSTPDEIGGICLNNQSALISSTCGAGWYADSEWDGNFFYWFPSTCHEFFTVWAPASDVDTPINYGMRRKGLCKLVLIEDASLGGNLTAIIKGNPSVLKLKADGKTYSLPVVPGSVVANGDGTYTAQFYTMDPETGQALVPAGDYSARCHGWSGSNDGGSNNTVSIGY